jgi:tRNA 2-thiouridine synthesizing protein A
MTQLTADRELDCRNTFCPMPIIRLREMMDAVESGTVVKVLATDPASVTDMPAFARNTGNELLASEKADGVFVYYFRKQ